MVIPYPASWNPAIRAGPVRVYRRITRLSWGVRSGIDKVIGRTESENNNRLQFFNARPSFSKHGSMVYSASGILAGLGAAGRERARFGREAIPNSRREQRVFFQPGGLSDSNRNRAGGHRQTAQGSPSIRSCYDPGRRRKPFRGGPAPEGNGGKLSWRGRSEAWLHLEFQQIRVEAQI